MQGRDAVGTVGRVGVIGCAGIGVLVLACSGLLSALAIGMNATVPTPGGNQIDSFALGVATFATYGVAGLSMIGFAVSLNRRLARIDLRPTLVRDTLNDILWILGVGYVLYSAVYATVSDQFNVVMLEYGLLTPEAGGILEASWLERFVVGSVLGWIALANAMLFRAFFPTPEEHIARERERRVG